MSHSNLRLEIKIVNPNPVFEKWLQKWLEQAIQKNAKSQHKLKEALQSLRSYPLPLSSGKECAILRGFGSTLCQMIDEEIKAQAKRCNSTDTDVPCNTFEQDVQQVKKYN